MVVCNNRLSEWHAQDPNKQTFPSNTQHSPPDGRFQGSVAFIASRYSVLEHIGAPYAQLQFLRVSVSLTHMFCFQLTFTSGERHRLYVLVSTNDIISASDVVIVPFWCSWVNAIHLSFVHLPSRFRVGPFYTQTPLEASCAVLPLTDGIIGVVDARVGVVSKEGQITAHIITNSVVLIVNKFKVCFKSWRWKLWLLEAAAARRFPSIWKFIRQAAGRCWTYYFTLSWASGFLLRSWLLLSEFYRRAGH